MKRLSIILLGLSFAVISTLSAQQPVTAIIDSSNTVLDFKKEVYTKENIPFKKPIPLPYVREADVMWYKVIWWMVDLREKQNLPLYYPTQPIGSRVNLVYLLLKGVESGEINAYDPDVPFNEFARTLSKEDLDLKFGARRDTTEVPDEDGNMKSTIIVQERKMEDVKRLMIKEILYVDKKHSMLKRQVIGICPIRIYSRGGVEDDASSMELKQTMWIYMPEARDILARHPIYNRFNDAQNVSFDDFFMQNRFSGYIYQISNDYDNRAINEYMSGVDALYEAQRIKMEIFDMEQNLWEY